MPAGPRAGVILLCIARSDSLGVPQEQEGAQPARPVPLVLSGTSLEPLQAPEISRWAQSVLCRSTKFPSAASALRSLPKFALCFSVIFVCFLFPFTPGLWLLPWTISWTAADSLCLQLLGCCCHHQRQLSTAPVPCSCCRGTRSSRAWVLSFAPIRRTGKRRQQRWERLCGQPLLRAAGIVPLAPGSSTVLLGHRRVAAYCCGQGSGQRARGCAEHPGASKAVPG